ncbi:hypothetical protein [Allonocardiopsis opalescens]|uniref:Uncharacterized protein n=1 Tax=Allonocardiopsis opalescens TaxID=1144618 RepID=A0A2T0PVM2_9ACTN|nr:hypothetical protein [Allonocardiopsis opalescens]PRX95584.1 hypothetical protein CLV72_109193 [Allonocardiopsis opalescens]
MARLRSMSLGVDQGGTHVHALVFDLLTDDEVQWVVQRRKGLMEDTAAAAVLAFPFRVELPHDDDPEWVVQDELRHLNNARSE